jgi:hypothetical protein
MIMTDFEAYKMYLALKAHFQTDQYNVIEMKGRIRASRKSYTSNKELIFKKLVKKYNDAEVCNFMVSNFIAGNHWGGVFDEEAARRYTAWQRRTQSLKYIFENDLAVLTEEAEGADWFTAEDGRHPLILKAFLRNSITPETLVILNRLTNFTDAIRLSNDPIWPDVKRLIIKYQPFLKFNREQFEEILHGHGQD